MSPLPSLSSTNAMWHTGDSNTSILIVAPLDFSVSTSALMSSTSKARLPPAVAAASKDARWFRAATVKRDAEVDDESPSGPKMEVPCPPS